MLKKSIRQNPGMLLNPLQCIGHRPPTKNYLATMSLVLGLRNLELGRSLLFSFLSPLFSWLCALLCTWISLLLFGQVRKWLVQLFRLPPIKCDLQPFTSKFNSVYTISFCQFHITGREIFIGSGISSVPIMCVKRWSCVGSWSLKKDYRKDILGKSEG